MSIDLVQYLNDRDQKHESGQSTIRPFITISRETGCHSRSIANQLQQEIYRLTAKKWPVISKELILDAAKELDINPLQVKHILNTHEKNHLEEILLAFGEHRYKSYQNVQNTLKNFISQVAANGHNIIIGRAGAIITSGMAGGIHVRLMAPLPWRVKSISQQMEISEHEAANFVKETDQKRNKLYMLFSGKELRQDFFDLIVNNQRISDKEIVSLILLSMEQRGFLKK